MIHMDTYRRTRAPATIQFYEPDDPELVERLNLLAVKESITTRTVRLMVKQILVRNGDVETVEWV